MSQLSEWADQYRAEIEKQASIRITQLESLLIAGDFEACHEWLEQWATEDAEPDSLRAKYRQSVEKKKLLRQRQINGGRSLRLSL